MIKDVDGVPATIYYLRMETEASQLCREDKLVGSVVLNDQNATVGIATRIVHGSCLEKLSGAILTILIK